MAAKDVENTTLDVDSYLASYTGSSLQPLCSTHAPMRAPMHAPMHAPMLSMSCEDWARDERCAPVLAISAPYALCSTRAYAGRAPMLDTRSYVCSYAARAPMLNAHRCVQ